MSNICVIFDHPYTADAGDNEPHHRSFSAALLDRIMAVAADNPDINLDLIDLHADNFDPVMHAEDLSAWRKREAINDQVTDYQARLLKADKIIFLFPVWWESMPAMTKGFMDKVIAPGIIYQQPKNKKRFVNEFTHLKQVELITTMSTPNLLYRLIFASPVTKILFRGTFLKMGFAKFKWHNFCSMDKQTLKQRQIRLDQFEQRMRAL